MTHNATQRIVVGLMSGTSLDGIDAVMAQLSGSGRSLHVETLGFVCIPYPSGLRDLLFRNSMPETSNVKDLSQLNVRLAHSYAEAVHTLVDASPVTLDEVQAIGCHGQTVFHVPVAEDCAGLPTRSTLQLGDPSTLANLLKTTVVGDFRLADMAVGGQGAPLASYFDYVYFTHDQEARALLNIGGIANMTVLPPDATEDRVVAFDTGPGNMVIDSLVQGFWEVPYDDGGRRARQGRIQEPLLTALLDEPYYALPPPKSTGRELYDSRYVGSLLSQAASMGIDAPEDIVATATALTAETIAQAYDAFVRPACPLDRFIVSGGGTYNAYLLELLAARVPGVSIHQIDDYGIASDAKEALFFAVMAHETLNRVPSNLASATGASQSTILGKICIPG